MLDRYGNVIRADGDQDQQQADWERAADMPQKGKNYMKPGWTVNDVEYPEYPTSRGHRYEAGGPSPANDVVTRDAGYTPYQSLFPHEPTSYDPIGRQYPQSRQDELALALVPRQAPNTLVTVTSRHLQHQIHISSLIAPQSLPMCHSLRVCHCQECHVRHQTQFNRFSAPCLRPVQGPEGIKGNQVSAP
jgi:hypothetical protein